MTINYKMVPVSDHLAAECDRLSATEANKFPHHWGRWYLEDGYLCTKIMRPQIGNHRGGSYEVYDIDTRACISKQSGQYWVDHMAEKNWISKQGLVDLEKAFEALLKEK
jgi:hypothetical protein